MDDDKEKPQRRPPHVLLVDDDPALLRSLKRHLEQHEVVVEVASDGESAVQKLTGNEFDVVVSDISMPRMSGLQLLRAVRDVARGKRYLSSAIAQGLALSQLQGDTGSPFDNLTPRELEIALMLNQGLRQEAIAKRLSLSAKTVNTHKTHLYDKLGVRDAIALARLVSQYGLVDPAQQMH